MTPCLTKMDTGDRRLSHIEHLADSHLADSFSQQATDQRNILFRQLGTTVADAASRQPHLRSVCFVPFWRHIFKIFNMVICFASIFVIDLKILSWTRTKERFGDKLMDNGTDASRRALQRNRMV